MYQTELLKRRVTVSAEAAERRDDLMISFWLPLVTGWQTGVLKLCLIARMPSRRNVLYDSDVFVFSLRHCGQHVSGYSSFRPRKILFKYKIGYALDNIPNKFITWMPPDTALHSFSDLHPSLVPKPSHVNHGWSSDELIGILLMFVHLIKNSQCQSQVRNDMFSYGLFCRNLKWVLVFGQKVV